MLNTLSQNLTIKTAIGLDASIELLLANKNPDLNLFRGDALELPFKANSFDIAIATAVIEHILDAGKMLKECWRVLKKGGLCILTTPDPFFECLATRIKHLEKGQHTKTFKLSELTSLAKSNGFGVLKAEKFMMSPIGFPYEVKIEKIMKRVKLDFLLLNQLLVIQKPCVS